MTNEEAFEKWAIDYGLDYEPSFTRYDVEASWQAAIAYMQEQNKSAEQSEPVYLASDGEGKWYEISERIYKGIMSDDDKKILYTSPQRQQPLKRLDASEIGFIFRKEMSLFEFYNALMDATEELNHD